MSVAARKISRRFDESQNASRHCHRSADIPVRSEPRGRARFDRVPGPFAFRTLLRTGMSALRPGSRVKKRPWRQVLCAIAGVGILLSACEQRASDSFARTSGSNAALRSFEARGVIRQLRPDADIVVIQHEAISNYMDAMTMPFNVRSGAELKGLQEGDVVSFRLQVSERQSWIDRITRSGESSGDAGRNSNRPPATTAAPARSRHPLLDYQFTNELGEA